MRVSQDVISPYLAAVFLDNAIFHPAIFIIHMSLLYARYTGLSQYLPTVTTPLTVYIATAHQPSILHPPSSCTSSSSNSTSISYQTPSAFINSHKVFFHPTSSVTARVLTTPSSDSYNISSTKIIPPQWQPSATTQPPWPPAPSSPPASQTPKRPLP